MLLLSSIHENCYGRERVTRIYSLLSQPQMQQEKEVLSDATFCKKQNLCFVQLKLIICYPPWLILLHFICNFLFFIILMKSEGLYHFLKSCNTGRIKRKSIRADTSFYVKNYFMVSEIVLLVCKNKLRLFSPCLLQLQHQVSFLHMQTL